MTTIINKVQSWLYETKNISFKIQKTDQALSFSIQLRSMKRKRVFENVVICVKWEDGMHISCSVFRASGRNQVEKILSIAILQDLRTRQKCSHQI